MNRFRIKVCGITRVSDASRAAQLGADLLGMIFYRQSPRFVTQQQAERICRVIPPLVHRVGVFVDEDPEKILSRARRLDLDFVQLHGQETAGDISFLKRNGLRVIKAFSIEDTFDFDAVMKSRADLRLVDNRTATRSGGTGQRFDWSLRPAEPIERLVIAGGIDIDNVAEAVRIFRPTVVDVNTGVERSPGIKSARKMAEFFEKCDRIRYVC